MEDIDADCIAEIDMEFDLMVQSLAPADSEPANRVEFALARAEFSAMAAARETANQLAAIDDALREAQDSPEIFVDPRICPAKEAADFAVRAAVAELATALAVSESMIRAQAAEAATLRERMPRIWRAFRDGRVSYLNARVIAEQAALLPEDKAILAEFEAAMEALAEALPTTKLRLRARALQEKLRAESLTERHRRTVADRRIFVEAAPDGMAWLGAYMPAEAAYRAKARIDAQALHLQGTPGEERTLAQLRADVFADLLTGDGTSAEVRATVAITVPVLTAMSESDEPGSLDGYGPIDAQTARRLAAKAPSFFRILTHPVSSAILDVDRTSYRVPADLRRWVAARDGGCVFPGCTRGADSCDLDHTVDWQHGGATAANNLAFACRGHHRLKHQTKWRMRRESGHIVWTSPTGRQHDTDPPPF